MRNCHVYSIRGVCNATNNKHSVVLHLSPLVFSQFLSQAEIMGITRSTFSIQNMLPPKMENSIRKQGRMVHTLQNACWEPLPNPRERSPAGRLRVRFTLYINWTFRSSKMECTSLCCSQKDEVRVTHTRYPRNVI